MSSSTATSAISALQEKITGAKMRIADAEAEIAEAEAQVDGYDRLLLAATSPEDRKGYRELLIACNNDLTASKNCLTACRNDLTECRMTLPLLLRQQQSNRPGKQPSTPSHPFVPLLTVLR